MGNDVVNQVLEDAQCIANGTKRRYQEEVNVNNLMKKQDSANENEKKDANESNEDEVSLEHSISLEVEDNSALFALTGPNSSNKVTKKRLSKKVSRQSIDLLGIGNNDNNAQQLQQSNGNTNTKKAESEENILDFLGVSTEKQQQTASKPAQQKPTIFDPLQDENDTIFTQQTTQKQPQPQAH